MKNKIKKTKVLCLASSAAQFLVYFKYLAQLEDIEYKLVIIDNNDAKEHSNYMNNLRERGMFYMVKEKNNDFILKPKYLGEQRLRDRGRVFSKYVLESGFAFNFEPDIIVFSQGGTVNYTIKELFPNKPKLIMYAEWFSITNMAARKEWPVVDDKKFIAQEWDIKSREDARNCDAIVVPSRYAKSLWPKEYHHKVHEIFEGIDTEYLSHERIGALSKMDRVLRKTHPKKKIVAYAARTIESTRGFDLWVNAYKQLREVRDDLHFVVIGKNKPNLSAGGGARNHGIEDFKKWSLEQHGFREEELSDVTWFDPLPMYDFLAVLKSVDLLIYPTIGMFSNWGFFMSMYMKVPIIAANNSYFPEVIDQGSNGFLVDPYDTAKVVELSHKVLNEADLAREMGLKGHETIRRDYSAKQANIKFLGLIDRLIQSDHLKRFASVIDRFDEGNYKHDVTVKSEYGNFYGRR